MKILGYFFASLFSVGTASADVYQWYDGDGDGSTWLSNSVVEPYADLSQQTLWWADLPFANLQHANLILANLSYANLFSANLSAANASYADLHGANLENTDLAYTVFVGANLGSSNIGNANLFYADLSDANLLQIENWESAFWLTARYNENTIFPDGMDPHEYGMIELAIPSPATSVLFTSICFTRRRRR